jgi:hypothetical protein
MPYQTTGTCGHTTGHSAGGIKLVAANDPSYFQVRLKYLDMYPAQVYAIVSTYGLATEEQFRQTGRTFVHSNAILIRKHT